MSTESRRRVPFPVAVAYSALVIVVALFVEMSLASDPDANFVGIWLGLVTLPACIPVWNAIPDNRDHLLVIASVAAGLSQCWLLVGLRGLWRHLHRGSPATE